MCKNMHSFEISWEKNNPGRLDEGRNKDFYLA